MQLCFKSSFILLLVRLDLDKIMLPKLEWNNTKLWAQLCKEKILF